MLKNFTDPKDLLVAALAQIETHPETWNQKAWRDTGAPCGTSYCLAGWMAELDGQQWSSGTGVIDQECLADGTHVARWAANVLGESVLYQRSDFMSPLFDATNTLPMLRAGVKAYCNGEDVEAAIDAADVDDD